MTHFVQFAAFKLYLICSRPIIQPSSWLRVEAIDTLNQPKPSEKYDILRITTHKLMSKWNFTLHRSHILESVCDR